MSLILHDTFCLLSPSITKWTHTVLALHPQAPVKCGYYITLSEHPLGKSPSQTVYRCSKGVHCSSSNTALKNYCLNWIMPKIDPRLGCQHSSSLNKAHLISFLQANVFDVLVPVKNTHKKKNEVAYFELVFRSGIAIPDLMLDWSSVMRLPLIYSFPINISKSFTIETRMRPAAGLTQRTTFSFFFTGPPAEKQKKRQIERKSSHAG